MFLTRPTLHVLLFVAVSALAACGEFIEDDINFDGNQLTTDITDSNGEAMLLDVLQSSVFAFRYSIFDQVIDSGYWEKQLDPNKAEERSCENGGKADIEYSSVVGDEHKVGDDFSINFKDCEDSNGTIHNGTLIGKYTSIEGTNTSFSDLTISECIDAFDRRFNTEEEQFEGFDEVVQETAFDMVIFRKGNIAVVEYFDFNEGTETAELRSRYEFSADQLVLAIKGGEVPSYFRIENLNKEELDCQGFQRRLDMDLLLSSTISSDNNFAEDLKITIEGDLEVYQSPEFGSMQTVTESDSVKITLDQNGFAKKFTYEDLFVNKKYSTSANTYVINVSSEATSNSFAGRLALQTFDSVSGFQNELYPFAGVLLINGRETEQSNLRIFESSVGVVLSSDGDVTGNGVGDATQFTDQTWDDFWNRNFVFAEN
jgi:hypothetical protein